MKISKVANISDLELSINNIAALQNGGYFIQVWMQCKYKCHVSKEYNRIMPLFIVQYKLLQQGYYCNV